MLQILTCLNNFIGNCFLLVLCSIPVLCSISFSFKRLGNYCNSENKETKHFSMNVSEKRLGEIIPSTVSAPSPEYLYFCKQSLDNYRVQQQVQVY